MPLRLLRKWPKTDGFEIFGQGPCYVTSVEKGSKASKAGLKPGDQILEVNGSDVTAMNAQQIKAMARTANRKSPELEVVSCLQRLEVGQYTTLI